MTQIRSLKPHEWPVTDQRSWAEACRPGGRLTRGGEASHLKPVTRKDLAVRYGQFLGFLGRTGQLTPAACASELITPEHVAAYITELTARVSSVSVHGAIAKLRRMGEILDPAWTSAWLRDIEQDLAWVMQPAPKFHRIVDSDRIVAAGLRLMQEADDGVGFSPCKRARLYRDGLMIALLAVCPIRLKNFAALTIGISLRKVEDNWLITLPASDTKTGRPDERMVPAFLAAHINNYITRDRRPANPGEQALWIGYTGKPLGYSAVERSVTEATRRTLGVPINPHLARDCAASTSCRHAGHHPGLASAILQHSDPRVTERHYNRARSASSSVEFARMIEETERGC